MIITLIICATVVLIVAIVAYYSYKNNTHNQVIERLDSMRSALYSIDSRVRYIEGYSCNIDGATSDIQDILEGKHKTEE